MDDKDIKYLAEHLENVLDKKVNGKIDRLEQKLDDRFNAHDEKMKPIYRAYQSAGISGRFIIWISKIFLAIGVIIGGTIAAFNFFGK